MRLRTARLWIVIGLLAVLVGASWTVRAAQGPQALFERARLLEENGKTLAEAITLYKQVVTQAGANRALAAQALLRAAECHQKLGQGEARVLYEQLLREYAEQPAATTARARLASNAPLTRSTGPSIEQVTTVSDPRTQISPDGRYLIAGDGNGQIGLREIATGKFRRLTEPAPGPAEPYWVDGTFSPDGRQIAYLWFSDGNANDDDGQLRIVNTAEGAPTPPRILYANPEVEVIAPQDWSADGAWIAVQVKRRDKTAQVGVVNSKDGSLRVLKSIEWIGSSTLSFSPDSRFLAYDRPSGEDEIDRDVFVIAVDGTRESPATHPGDDRVVGWTTDGSRLLISSDRGGTVGLWALPLRGGALQSAEYLTEFGTARSLGLTDAGVLYSAVLRAGADISVASFDPTTGQLAGPPVRPIRQFAGQNGTATWSPDGKYLAYLSKRDPLVPSPMTIVIHSLESGKTVRELRPKLGYLGTLRWGGPAGRTFIARGADLKGRSGIVRIDTETGDASLAVPEGTCSGVPFWSADGSSFFCFSFGNRRILQMDALSGEIRRRFENAGQGLGASPDGRYVLAGIGPTFTLLTVSNDERRELFRFTEDTRVANWYSVAWTPDSQGVAYTGTFRGKQGAWLVPISGGEPRQIKVDLGLEALSQMQFNPATAQMAFGPSPRPDYDVRRMENFLPTPVSGR